MNTYTEERIQFLKFKIEQNPFQKETAMSMMLVVCLISMQIMQETCITACTLGIKGVRGWCIACKNWDESK